MPQLMVTLALNSMRRAFNSKPAATRRSGRISAQGGPPPNYAQPLIYDYLRDEPIAPDEELETNEGMLSVESSGESDGSVEENESDHTSKAR